MIEITPNLIQEASLKATGKRRTKKQVTFIKEFMETQDHIGATEKAYPDLKNRNVISTVANENLQKPTIQETTREVANRLGMTPDFLITALREDIEGKPGNRARELEIAGKWTKLEERTPSENPGVTLKMTLEQAERLLSRRNDVITVPEDVKEGEIEA